MRSAASASSDSAVICSTTNAVESGAPVARATGPSTLVDERQPGL